MALFPASCYFPLSQAPSSFPVPTKLPGENQGREEGFLSKLSYWEQTEDLLKSFLF